MTIPVLHPVEQKFLAAMLTILMVGISAITVLYVQDIRAENRHEAELDLAADARLRETEIEAALQAYGGDIRTLANTPPVSAIPRATANLGVDPASGSSYEQWLTRLATIFVAFAKAESGYLQLRYLDRAGVELVRVDNDDSGAVRVPQAQLQDKSARGYFIAARSLAAGDVYVSPLDLNIEHGRMEEPYVPVLRFVTPVFDAGGQFAGALVTNVDPEELLAPLGAQGRVNVYLVDGSGQYLFHPDESRRFGDLLATGAGLASDLGPEVAALLTSRPGLLTVSGRMFARTRVKFAGLSTANEWWVVDEIALADVPGANVAKPIVAAAVLLLMAAAVGYWVIRGLARQLKESEERFRAVFETSYDGVIAYDAELRYRLWSPAMERMMGVPAADVLGHEATTVFPFLEETDEGKAMRGALTGIATQTPPVPYEVPDSGANGYTEATHLPVRDSRGRVNGGMAIIRNVTERVQAEKALLKSQQELRGLNSELEQRVRRRTSELEAANQELEAFSYSVSHDLRSPLRAVDGFTQAVLVDHGDALDDEGRRLLNRVREASRRMSELIDDLLEMARVSAADMHHEPVDMTSLAHDVSVELSEDLDGRAIDVVIEDDLRAVGDATLVRVLLVCLLDNAFKFTRCAPQARIEIGETEHDGRSCFFVRDNGVGFDPRHVHRLFKPFQRLHSTDEFEGTGIGLATVKRVANRHGGDAWAEGEVGEGVTMFFTLKGSDDA